MLSANGKFSEFICVSVTDRGEVFRALIPVLNIVKVFELKNGCAGIEVIDLCQRKFSKKLYPCLCSIATAEDFDKFKDRLEAIK